MGIAVPLTVSSSKKVADEIQRLTSYLKNGCSVADMDVSSCKLL